MSHEGPTRGLIAQPAVAGRRELGRLATVVVVLAFLAMLVPVPTATAALGVTVARTDGIGVASRNAPQLAARDGRPGIPEGAPVTTLCWEWGEAVGPYANRLWWVVLHAGREVHVPDRYLTTPNLANQPPASEPECGRPGPSVPVPGTATHTGTFVTDPQPLRLCPDPGNGWCLPAGSPKCPPTQP